MKHSKLFSPRALVLAAVALALAAAAPATMPATPPAVGDMAKDFNLNDLAGQPVSLASAEKDGPVVVIFLRGWVGYQCPICTKQVGDFVVHADDFKAAHARVLLIYPGPAAELKEKAAEFSADLKLPEGFTLLTDPETTTATAWNLRWNKKGETAYPSTFVIDTTNKITFAKISHSHADRAAAADVLKVIPKM